MKILYIQPSWANSLNEKVPVCIFSHYDPNSKIEPYVLHYLRELKRCGFQTVLVSTSPSIDAQSVEALEGLAAACLLRDNIGYDFGSYKTGIDFVQSIAAKPKQLLITNDSVFGPLGKLDQLLANGSDYDVYGMTDSYDHHYHLQSFFILYNSVVLESDAFRDFWHSVELIKGHGTELKRKIIMRYEVGGSQHFLKNGFKLGSAFPFAELLNGICQRFKTRLHQASNEAGAALRPFAINFNATHCYWDLLVDQGFPFIKRELLLHNPTNSDISKWPERIAEFTDYDLKMVVSALKNFGSSDDFFFTGSVNNILQRMDQNGRVTLPINSALKNFQKQYAIEDLRTFSFDEESYLNENPDVKAAIINGSLSDGLIHYRTYGHLENRRLRLTKMV